MMRTYASGWMGWVLVASTIRVNHSLLEQTMQLANYDWGAATHEFTKKRKTNKPFNTVNIEYPQARHAYLHKVVGILE